MKEEKNEYQTFATLKIITFPGAKKGTTAKSKPQPITSLHQ